MNILINILKSVGGFIVRFLDCWADDLANSKTTYFSNDYEKIDDVELRRSDKAVDDWVHYDIT